MAFVSKKGSFPRSAVLASPDMLYLTMSSQSLEYQIYEFGVQYKGDGSSRLSFNKITVLPE